MCAALVDKTEVVRAEVRGDRERPHALLQQGDAGAARPRRADRELHPTIRAVARAGVPVLGYHFMPNSVWTTDRAAPTRGGAVARKFDMAAVDAVADDVAAMKAMMPTTLGHQSTMPAYAEGRRGRHGRGDVGQLRLLHQGGAAGRRGGGHSLALHPDDPPVPMLGGVARLFYQPGGFKHAYELAGSQQGLGARPLPRLLLGNAGRQGQRPRDDRVFRAEGRNRLHPLPRRQGHGAELHRMLHRRGQLRPRRSDDRSCTEPASTASCSTTTSRRWTTTPTGTIAAAPTPSATCRA